MVRTFFLMALLCLFAMTSQVQADSQDHAQMMRLAEQRDRLTLRLRDLDRLSADRMIDGEQPHDIHAVQIELERELEQVQRRLETLSARSGLAVPQAGAPMRHRLEQRQQTEERALALLERGKGRALEVVRQDAREFLASLDFTEFLSRD